MNTKKTQFYNNLVDLQCKCMRLDTPRIGPIWGFSAVTESSNQNFQYIEADKPQVFYIFRKGFYPTL